MKKVTAYTVVTEDDYDKFVKEVNNMIAAGWQPSIGFAVTSDLTQLPKHERDQPTEYYTTQKFYQPMMKYAIL